MRQVRFKKGYRKRDGTVVRAHAQGYTYRDFVKLRLKKLLAQQKGKKDTGAAFKQMGQEWKKAKGMTPADVNKNYGLFAFSTEAKLNPPKLTGSAKVDLD